MSASTPTLTSDFASCGTIVVVRAASLRVFMGSRAVWVAWMTCPSATATCFREDPVSSRFVLVLLKLLVAAESKKASLSMIAAATAAVSSCLRFHRTRCRAHLREFLVPGWRRMGLRVILGVVLCGGGAAESLVSR